MDLDALDRLLSAAQERTGHSAFVVVGSLAILGILRQRTIPERMLLSRDVDCYTRDDPGRIFELQDELGEGSAFDQVHGYFLDPVSPNLPTLGNSDIQVSSICLGSMTFGQQNTEAEAHEQLNAAFSRGINFIDAAEMYPVPSRAETTGRTEQYVGSWLKRQARDKVILATKATGPAHSLSWIRDGHLSFTQANLRRALEGSLKRLQTDFVDLYQLHWPDRNTPMFGGYHFDPEQERETVSLRESLETLAGFIKEGKVRAWGPSNETPWGLMTFLRLADELGLPRPVSVQNAYSLLNRTWENGLAEIGYREKVSLLAYSPLGFGFLTGKYQKDPRSSGRANLFSDFAQRYKKPNTAKAVAAYVDLAEQHGLTPTQLSLAFVYQRWCVGSTIIGATSMAQLQENLDAADVTLSPEVLQTIERIHLDYPNPAP